MSGQRFISVVLILVATFFWGSFVVHQWDANKRNQKNIALQNEADRQAAKEAQATLDRADEMAIAASEEFSKRIKAEGDVASEKIAEKKVVALKQDTSTNPDKKATWEVPTGNDPVYTSRITDDIKSAAEGAKKQASDAAETVGGKISELASKITGKLMGERWKVPTGVTPGETETMEDAKKTARWKVPTSNDPHYDKDLVAVDVKDETKLSDVQRPVADKDGAVIRKLGDAEISVTGKIIPVATSARKILQIVEKTEARLSDGSRLEDGKDVSRLTKDLKAVPARKYSWTRLDGKNQDLQVAAVDKKQSQWVVPTGVTPDYGVVDKLERGIETVKDMASDAGNEIAEQVTDLGANIKGAIAAPEKWKVPTGVTPGEKEVKVAKLEKKDETKKKSAETSSGKIKLDEDEVFISSKIEDFQGKSKRLADAKQNTDGKSVSAKETEGAEKAAEKSGVISRIIDYFSDEKDSAKKAVDGNDPYSISKGDRLRFEANKTLMIDEVAYKFTNVRKGQGKLDFSGRAQPSAKLLLYSGPRYLGEVVADDKGEWNFSREMYLPKGKHIIHAQQVTKGGLVLVRKSLPLVQARNVKPPKGYKESTGLGLGDKALTVLNEKLSGKKKSTAQKDSKKTKVAALKMAPLPVRKTKKEPKIVEKGDVKKVAARSITPQKDKVKKADDKKSKVVVLKKRELEVKDKKAKEVKVAVKDTSKVTAKKPTDKKAKAKAKAETTKIAAVDKKAKVSEKVTAQDKKAKAGAVQKTRYYTVKPGDTLAKIAKRVYGKPGAFTQIVKLNPQLIKNPNKIYPKQKLVVAGGEAIFAKKKSPDVKVAAKGKAVKAAKKPEKTKFYLVKPGDSLWKIAKKVYGNGARYKELIRLNPEGLKDPNKIKPKLKLVVAQS